MAQKPDQLMKVTPNEYRTAIAFTVDAIHARAYAARLSTVALALVFVIVVPLSIYALGWRGLVAVFWIVPLAGAFFLADSILLSRWQKRLLASWSAGRIDFFALISALRAQSMLPKDTLEGMIASLPSAPDLVVEQAQVAEIRERIASLVQLNSRYESNRRGLRLSSSLLLAIGLSSVAVFGWGKSAIALALLAPTLEIVFRTGMDWQLVHRVRRQLVEANDQTLKDLYKRGQLAKPWTSLLGCGP